MNMENLAGDWLIGRFFLGKIFTPSLLKLFTKKELLLFLLEFSYESWDFIGSLKWYRALLKWEMAIFKPLLAFFFFLKGIPWACLQILRNGNTVWVGPQPCFLLSLATFSFMLTCTSWHQQVKNQWFLILVISASCHTFWDWGLQEADSFPDRK